MKVHAKREIFPSLRYIRFGAVRRAGLNNTIEMELLSLSIYREFDKAGLASSGDFSGVTVLRSFLCLLAVTYSGKPSTH